MRAPASTRWRKTARTRLPSRLRRRLLLLWQRDGREQRTGRTKERAERLYGGQNPTHYRDQEKRWSWRPPWRRVESCVCRLCDRDDVAFYRAVADGAERSGKESRGWVLQRSEGNRQSA